MMGLPGQCVASSISLAMGKLRTIYQLLSKCASRAEAIAFYKGERREEAGALQRLMRLVRVSRVLIVWSTMLSLWTHYYRHASICSKLLSTRPVSALYGVRRYCSCPQYCKACSAFQQGTSVYVYALRQSSDFCLACHV